LSSAPVLGRRRGASRSDAPVKAVVEHDQAKQVDDIQKKYRKPFAAKRQEFNRKCARRRAKTPTTAPASRARKITTKLRRGASCAQKTTKFAPC
jgi:hypothetical protein